MIDLCTVVVLDFELKKVYLQTNSLQLHFVLNINLIATYFNQISILSATDQ